jgi:STE24 endopeptidase
MRIYIALLAAALATSLYAQQARSGTRALQIPAQAQAGPQFTAEAATRAYLATVPPEKKARSDAYYEGGYWLILWDFLYGAAVMLWLLFSGISARMRDLAGRITKRRPLQTWLYWIGFSVLTFVIGLPLSIYEGFVREHQYQLSNQSFGAWFGDQMKALGLTCVLGGLAVVALFAVVRRLPRTWHVWGAVTAIVLQAIAMLIGPVFIAPMFNQYTLLEDARIRDPILRLARANGIPASRVYEVDASRQSSRISANVSGFLGTERITLNDNLLNRCSPEAILAVMGHEMGHYVLNHVYKLLTFMLIVVVVFFAVLRWSLDWSLARWGARWGIRDAGDPAVLPLAVLILSILAFLYTPAGNTLTRTEEYEADLFGLNAAREPDGFAEAALLLGDYRKLDPGPVEEFLFFDHPSGRTRIYAAMRWKAENPCVPGTLKACAAGQ